MEKLYNKTNFRGLIGEKGEKQAVKILNSNKLNHKWKKDFKIDPSTEEWDLINSDNVKIEVKSTTKPYTYKINHIKFNWVNQDKQIIMRLLLDHNLKIKEYKFLKKIRGKIVDITSKILNKK